MIHVMAVKPARVDNYNSTFYLQQLEWLPFFLEKKKIDWDINLLVFFVEYRATMLDARYMSARLIFSKERLRLPCNLVFESSNQKVVEDNADNSNKTYLNIHQVATGHFKITNQVIKSLTLNLHRYSWVVRVARFNK